jgi:uncharacterized protein (TIGR02453 family)
MYFFTQDIFQFLEDISQNNNKEWFLTNKERYTDSLLNPLKQLVIELTPTMLKIDKLFEVEASVDKTISRIYRDTRFSKDKKLYKNTMWITFVKKNVNKNDYPAFFFEISSYSFRYGMGFFSASTKSMNSIRASIDANSKHFKSIIGTLSHDSIFVLEGELYKKNRYPGNDESIRDWYNRKSMYLVYNVVEKNELLEKNFITTLKDDYTSLTAIYHYLTQALHKYKTD